MTNYDSMDSSDINGPNCKYGEMMMKSNLKWTIVLGGLALLSLPVKLLVEDYFVRKEANDDIDTTEEG